MIDLLNGDFDDNFGDFVSHQITTSAQKKPSGDRIDLLHHNSYQSTPQNNLDSNSLA